MLEIIVSSLKNELQQEFGDEQNFSPDKADSAVALAKDEIFDTVKDEAGRGNLSGLMSLLQQKEQLAAHPIVINTIRKYAGKLGTQLALDPETADKVANFAIPFAIGKLISLSEEQGMDPAMLMALLGNLSGHQ
jgi:hypothetical protein